MSIFKNKKPVVAIDGTAGSGKGTLAKNLSKIIDFDHLDSGVLYRILACKLLKSGGLINSIVKSVESPGITISVSFGSSIVPVTSVVRK